MDDVVVLGKHMLRAHFLLAEAPVDGICRKHEWHGVLGFRWFNSSVQALGHHKGSVIGRWGDALGLVPKKAQSSESPDDVAVGYSVLPGLSAFKRAVKSHFLQWAPLDGNNTVPAFVKGHYG